MRTVVTTTVDDVAVNVSVEDVAINVELVPTPVVAVEVVGSPGEKGEPGDPASGGTTALLTQGRWLWSSSNDPYTLPGPGAVWVYEAGYPYQMMMLSAVDADGVDHSNAFETLWPGVSIYTEYGPNYDNGNPAFGILSGMPDSSGSGINKFYRCPFVMHQPLEWYEGEFNDGDSISFAWPLRTADTYANDADLPPGTYQGRFDGTQVIAAGFIGTNTNIVTNPAGVTQLWMSQYDLTGTVITRILGSAKSGDLVVVTSRDNGVYAKFRATGVLSTISAATPPDPFPTPACFKLPVVCLEVGGAFGGSWGSSVGTNTIRLYPAIGPPMLVLGPSTPVPAGTPAETVIVRTVT